MLLIPLMQMIGGLVLLVAGGEALVRGAVALAKNIGIPVIIIGLTVVALGTSAPEIIVSIKAALENHPDIAVGNIVGSNISNTLLVLGATALIWPVSIDIRLKRFDGYVLLLATLLFVAAALTGTISTLHGILLLLALAAYNVLLYRAARKVKKSTLPKKQAEEAEELLHVTFSTQKALLFVITGCIALAFGADILVEGAIALAITAHISEAVIGLTIVAIGSSLPELVSSVIAAYHKESGVAAGNVIGSNIMNILAGLGISAAITPLSVAPSIQSVDIWIMLAVTIGLILLLLRFKTIQRNIGVVGLIAFVAYIAFQVMREI